MVVECEQGGELSGEPADKLLGEQGGELSGEPAHELAEKLAREWLRH
jgi:hypothetical protein